MLLGSDASATTRYVWQESPSPAPPYTSWATAATNIQDAVDAADPGDTVLVTNGVYATGGRAVYGSMTNRVAIDRAIALESLMGPEVTIIQGAAAIRCVYVGTNAVVSGFTLANGRTRSSGDVTREQSGAGAWCELSGAVTNCILSGNWAATRGGGAYQGTLNHCTLTSNGAEFCGGAYSGTLNHCKLSSNSASYMWGGGTGGAQACTLNHCTLTGNSAPSSMYAPGVGGAQDCTLNHCTLVDNDYLATHYCTLDHCIVCFNYANYWDYAGNTFNFCCTTPLPDTGMGNIDLDPFFVDTNGWSDLRLQSNSPCINAGNDAYVTDSTDLDGNPRIVSGTVDIGAYEYQGPGSLISYAWLQHYGLPTDGSADTLDSDLDGHNTWQEWKAWTDPTSALSVLKLLMPQPQTNGTVVIWQSVLGHSYSVERATNASGPFSLLRANVPGRAGTTSVTDTNPANGNAILYRVGVPE